MADTFITLMKDADPSIFAAVGDDLVTVKDENGVHVGSVEGAFETQYVEAQGVQGYLPTFTYIEANLPIGDGYEITHQSQAYNVRFRKPEDAGVVMLILGEK